MLRRGRHACLHAASRSADAGRSSERRAQIPVRTRLAAAELTLGRSVTACLHTAAEIYGFAVAQDGRTHVIGASRSTLDTLAVHRTPPVGPVRPVDRIAVVDAAETAVRLAGQEADAPHTLAVLDSALRAQATNQPALAAMSAQLHVNRIGEVRDLVTLADPRAESPPESWLRWVCHDAGLPAPVPQCWVECADGQWVRLDLGWPRYKLGLEYDGVQFHTGTALTRDRARLNALIRTGWTIVHCTTALIFDGRANWSNSSATSSVFGQVDARGGKVESRNRALSAGNPQIRPPN